MKFQAPIKPQHPIGKHCAIHLRGYLAALRNRQALLTEEMIQLCEDIATLEAILATKNH